jgi:hypothetical protein
VGWGICQCSNDCWLFTWHHPLDEGTGVEMCVCGGGDEKDALKAEAVEINCRGQCARVSNFFLGVRGRGRAWRPG